MFDVGFAEIFLLSLIGLIVLGPEKLPRVARTLGGLVRRARSSWYSLRRSIEAEIAEADMTEPLKKAAADIEQVGRSLEQTIDSAGETEIETASRSPSGDDQRNPQDG